MTSHSWVEASKVQLSEDRSLGEVVGLQAVSWIGSNLEEVGDHKWLVQLKKGETLEIVELRRMTIRSSAAPTTFYQIAPPAGEFRWILEKEVASVDFRARQAKKEEKNARVDLTDSRIIVEEPADSEPRRDVFVARRARRKTTAVTTPARRPAGTLPSSNSNVTTSSPRLSDGAFETQMKDLDLQLAIAVTRPPEHWQLQTLREQIETLTDQAGNTVQRARAGVMLDKLAEFENLQQQYLGLESTDRAADVGLASATSAESDSDSDDAGETTAPIDPRFDAAGWLLPVHSTKRESPPYALLDREGNILQFVSPAPGLNLHRYLRKEVGIFGQRGFIRQLQKPHVTAHRIVDLARHRG
jgi:hypothetical protein